MSNSLYERLGGEAGIKAIASDAVDNHYANPKISVRFKDFDKSALKNLAFEFFAMGTGGPQQYSGRDLTTAHKGMNINEEEYFAAMDDITSSLDKHGIDDQTKSDVIGILYSLKGEIIKV